MYMCTYNHINSLFYYLILPTVAECDPLKPPDKGDVELSGLTIGSHATYSCESGYELVGTEFRTCLNNGLWSGEEPTCFGN